MKKKRIKFWCLSAAAFLALGALCHAIDGKPPWLWIILNSFGLPTAYLLTVAMLEKGKVP